MRRLLLALSLLAGPAWAEDSSRPLWFAEADLDGDGVVEAYTLREDGESSVDLVVTEGTEERVVPGAAWMGGAFGQLPELEVSQGGSVRLTSMNDAIGRDRWHLVLTIAHRDGDWRVAGITYERRDTLDLASWARCDLNLLSGRGVVETDVGVREVEAPDAPLLWDWNEATLPDLLPVECFG